MTNELSESTLVLPAHGDLFRVVPLYRPQEIEARAAAAHLTFHNGPLLSAVEVFTIFWGSAWQQQPQSDLANSLNQFFDSILTSPLMDQLAEYSVEGQQIVHGRRSGTATITSPNLHHSVTDSAIQHMLQQEISSNAAFPQPTANTLYFVYLPPRVAVVQGGGASCKVFCGYHDDISGKIFYAVMPFPGCHGCTGNLSQLDALTSTSSHELCEAITDAIPGEGWYDDPNNEEIGDICAWQTKKIGDYTVQLEWSNKEGKCV